MSYQGVFLLDDEGIRFCVHLPTEGEAVRNLIVSFTFEQIHNTLNARALMHSIIARRIVEATRSLDEED